MGRIILKSALMSKTQNLIDSATDRQQNVYEVMTALNDFASDSVLTGEAYKNAKGFISRVYIPICKALCMALEDEITANRKVLSCCTTYLKGTDRFDENAINGEVERLKSEYRKLSDPGNLILGMILPAAAAINADRIAFCLWRIKRLEHYLEELDRFDKATKNLHNSAVAQMDTICKKIDSIFSPALFSNGKFDYSRIDMSWTAELLKKWDGYKAQIDGKLRHFTLPEAQRQEIDDIINSDISWEEKTEQIRRVYERYLFENVKDKDGNNPFIDYARRLAEARSGNYKNDSDAQKKLLKNAEEFLGKNLQNSGIDIQAVNRALNEDFLRAMPQNVNRATKMLNFINLVKTGAPADLKTNALEKAIGKKSHKDCDFDFSIWSRRWKPDMTGDYLGNYGFGYIGARYWQGIDFDDAVKAASLKQMAIPSGGGANFITGIGLYIDGTVSVSALRTANPDKTDAEMFCRIGAGVAQLQSDNFDVAKYVKSVLDGDWGDNKDDSNVIGEGFDDYYRAHGIDKMQIIKEERKLW